MTLQSPTTTLIPLFSSSELTGCGYHSLLDRKNHSDMCPRWESNPRLPACKASTLPTRPDSPLFYFFSFSHSEVDILLQTQCLLLNFDAKTCISAVRSQHRTEQHCPRAQEEVCMHAPISYSQECIKNNTMTITRDIIRVFYHITMAVCSTVYIHLFWGSQKT